MDNKGQEISVNSMIGFIYSRGRPPLPGAVSMYHHWIVIAVQIQISPSSSHNPSAGANTLPDLKHIHNTNKILQIVRLQSAGFAMIRNTSLCYDLLCTMKKIAENRKKMFSAVTTVAPSRLVKTFHDSTPITVKYLHT